MDHTQHNYSSDRAGHGEQGEPATASSEAHETAARPGDYEFKLDHAVSLEMGGVHELPTRTRLLQDFVCLKFPDLPKLSSGGIVLEAKRYYGVDTNDGGVMRDAVVVAVGPGKWVEHRVKRPEGGYTWKEAWHPTALKVGDRVALNALKTQGYLYDEWDGDRGDYRLVREDDVDAVLDGVEVLVA